MRERKPLSMFDKFLGVCLFLLFLFVAFLSLGWHGYIDKWFLGNDAEVDRPRGSYTISLME